MGNLDGVGKDLVLLARQFAQKEITRSLGNFVNKYELSDRQITLIQFELILLRLSMIDYWLYFAYSNQNISESDYLEILKQLALEEIPVMEALSGESLFERKDIYIESYGEDFTEMIASKDDDFLFMGTTNVMIKQVLGTQWGLGTEDGMVATMEMAKFIGNYCRNIFPSVVSILKERKILKKNTGI